MKQIEADDTRTKKVTAHHPLHKSAARKHHTTKVARKHTSAIKA